MPIDGSVKFSKPVKTKKGFETLGLFGTPPGSKKIELLEVRVCEKKKGKFNCINASKEPTKRAALARKIGVKL